MTRDRSLCFVFFDALRIAIFSAAVLLASMPTALVSTFEYKINAFGKPLIEWDISDDRWVAPTRSRDGTNSLVNGAER